MRKGGIEFGVLMLFLLVFLSIGVFAVPPALGTCSIVTPSECVAAAGNYRIMGLSNMTNSHGQVPYQSYPYVLCCAFGTGNTTCTNGNPSNKIIGLSSSTNAHAEAPSQTNYPAIDNVCYEDLQCIASTNNCGASGTDAANYKLNVTSLSAVTNAHIGPMGSFPGGVNICCNSPKFLSTCTIQSVSWNQVVANNGVQVYITVKGSGPECSGQTVTFNVIGAQNSNATTVTFNGDTALSWWDAEWQSAGILGGDMSYSVNATIAGVLTGPGKSMLSSNQLTVQQMSVVDHCSTITSCEDYTDPNECNTDSPCGVADSEGISQGVQCDNTKTYCSCAWDSTSGTCGFRWSIIQPGTCNPGYTLCHDTSSGVDYCYPGNTCPSSTSTPSSNNNGVCDPTDSCASTDCHDGDQASCVAGSQCSGGMCSGTPPANNNVTCNYGFTLCQVSGRNYCYPGSLCPSGQIPPSNGNGKCDPGEGCLSTECSDGSQDSCISGTYCVSGKCASIQDPISAQNSSGGCKITQSVQKDCNVEPTGTKVVKWTGTWTGANPNPSDPIYQKCLAGGTATIPCPAEIQLPFFGYTELGIALIVIALVYVILMFRKKPKSRKKK